jgi:phage/plasmid-associated DNA primase
VEEMEKSKHLYQSKINSALGFVEERCTQGPDWRILPKQLYKEYVAWCEECKIQPMIRMNFDEQIELNFPSVKRQRVDTKMHYVGIGVLPEEI